MKKSKQKFIFSPTLPTIVETDNQYHNINHNEIIDNNTINSKENTFNHFNKQLSDDIINDFFHSILACNIIMTSKYLNQFPELIYKTNGDYSNGTLHTICETTCDSFIIIEKMILLLLQHKASITIKNKQEMCPLMYYITIIKHDNNIMIPELFLKAGAMANTKIDTNGITALHIAYSKHFYNIMKLLVKNGANMNIPDDINKTRIVDTFKDNKILKYKLLQVIQHPITMITEKNRKETTICMECYKNDIYSYSKLNVSGNKILRKLNIPFNNNCNRCGRLCCHSCLIKKYLTFPILKNKNDNNEIITTQLKKNPAFFQKLKKKNNNSINKSLQEKVKICLTCDSILTAQQNDKIYNTNQIYLLKKKSESFQSTKVPNMSIPSIPRSISLSEKENKILSDNNSHSIFARFF